MEDVFGSGASRAPVSEQWSESNYTIAPKRRGTQRTTARAFFRHANSMIHSAKDLSPDQKLTMESLLGRPVSEQKQISIRTVPVTPAPLDTNVIVLGCSSLRRHTFPQNVVNANQVPFALRLQPVQNLLIDP